MTDYLIGTVKISSTMHAHWLQSNLPDFLSGSVLILDLVVYGVQPRTGWNSSAEVVWAVSTTAATTAQARQQFKQVAAQIAASCAQEDHYDLIKTGTRLIGQASMRGEFRGLYHTVYELSPSWTRKIDRMADTLFPDEVEITEADLPNLADEPS